MFYQIHHIASSEYLKKEYGENFSYPPHLHQCFELITVPKGSMAVTVSGVTYRLEAGDAILLFPNEIHSLSSDCSEHMLFIFSSKLIRAFVSKYTGKIPQKRVRQLPPYLFEALHALEADSSVVEIKGVLYSAVSCFEKDTDFVSAEHKENELLARIFTFVEENFHKECLLSDLAKELGYNNAYLSRAFKQATGIAYNTYVNVCRLNNASYLLHNSDLSILACAIESGYKSLRTFNRNFKQHFSVTPNEYRAALL